MARTRKDGLADSRFSLAIVALLVAVMACACQSSSGTGSGSAADLKLSFTVLGASASATAKSGSSASKSISRLVLSSASTLTVSLTPLDSGLSTPAPQTVSIASSTDTQVVSVSFSAVEYGSYTIKAVASDSSGVAQFQQSSTVTVSESTTAAALTLVPSNVDATSITGSSMISVSTILDPGKVYTWSVPVSVLSSGQYMLRAECTSSTDEFKIYALDKDGTIFFSGYVNNMSIINTSSSSSMTQNVTPTSGSEPSYLTVYNDSSSSLTITVMINYAT
jgi:hypothetical protein